MGNSRNTSGLAHEVSHGCTDVYLELDLQTRLHHPTVLLGSIPQRKLYHHPMQHYQNMWRTVLCLVWVCSGDADYGTLVMKVLLSCKLDF